MKPIEDARAWQLQQLLSLQAGLSKWDCRQPILIVASGLPFSSWKMRVRAYQ